MTGALVEGGMILETLRRETAELHARLDAQPPLTRLMSDGVTLAEYRQVLAAFLPWLAPREAALARFTDDFARFGLDLAARARTPALTRDLAWCAGAARSPLAGARPAVPAAAEPPLLAGLGEAFGCLYVMEGSTLGGQVILRHVRPRLGVSPEAGAAFFASHGRAVGLRWRELQSALVAFAASGPFAAAMIAGARATFHDLLPWLEAAA